MLPYFNTLLKSRDEIGQFLSKRMMGLLSVDAFRDDG
jgi:hypothetical protein